MIRAFLLSTALVAIGGSAFGADLPARVAAPAPAHAPLFTWSGFYAGAHAGYSWNKIEGATTASDGSAGRIATRESADIDANGWMGGVQAGYNHQYANGVVIGVEADLSALGNKATAVDLATANAYRDETQSTIRYKQDWMATARLRLGYAIGPVLVYGTGGLAALRETETRTQYQGDSLSGATAPAFSERDERTRLGWALGAGAEWAFASNWSVKAEYLYAHFNSEKFYFPNARGGVGNNFDEVTGRIARNKSDVQSVRIGVNYKF